MGLPRSEIQLDFEQSYRSYLEAQWVRYSAVSAGIAIVLVPVFSLLDWLVYPDWFVAFLIARMLCAIIIAAAVVVAVKWLRKLLPLASVGCLILVQVMIAWMIGVTEGQYSGYYAGLNLPIIGMGLFLPTVFIQTFLFCVLSLILYTGACLAGGGRGVGYPFR
jgi:hypothetical protein